VGVSEPSKSVASRTTGTVWQITEIYEGTSEVQRLVISRHVLR
jgi:alkylation response protein AidB-like acyl-CoA dehydrogenase